MTIKQLPEECLTKVFNFLSVADRTRVERVNKRWQNLTKLSWNNSKELIVDPKFLGLKPFGKKHQYVKIYDFRLREILKRCGNYLKKIDLSSITHCLLSEVAENCPNIESIKCSNPSEKGLKKLTEKCKNICELIINDLIKFEDAYAI